MQGVMGQIQDTSAEVMHDFGSSIGEQFGVQAKEGRTEENYGLTGFWEDFKEQLSSGKSPEQMQHEASGAHHAEQGKTPQELAAIRHRLQELNAPQPHRPSNYEYRGPEVASGQEQAPQHSGPQVPTTPSTMEQPDFRRGHEIDRRMGG